MPNPFGYSPPFMAGFGLKRRPCRQTCVYPPPKSPLSHKWLFLLATRQRVQALSALVPQRRFLEGDLPRPALRELVFFLYVGYLMFRP